MSVSVTAPPVSVDMSAAAERPKIGKVDNVLGEQHRSELYRFLSGPGWQFGWKSSAKKDRYSFWHKHYAGNRLSDHEFKGGRERSYDCAEELRQNAPLIHGLWRDLAERYLPGHMLTRCYANGQPFGSEGTTHTDSVSDRSRTIVYYPHEAWHADWGGETIFFNEAQDDIIASVYPRPNRMVIFAGNIPHVARGVSRTCPVMRITLMFKAEWIGIEPRHRTFLVDELGLDRIRHSGRDFFSHLSGTHKLLRSWGNPNAVCLAGLFHSIYGTWHFRHKAFPIERRDVIRALIGEEAERLVYAFCVVERPKDFLAQIESGAEVEVMDHFRRAPLRLSRAELNRLLEIEAANLIEQGGASRGTLEAIAMGEVSSGAKRAIQRLALAKCE